jgi:hypothetical protein
MKFLGGKMKKLFYFLSMMVLMLAFANIHAAMMSPYMVVTISNDPNNNELLVYDADGEQVQAISTKGKGGVGPHIVGGGVTSADPLVGVINYGSQSVSLFKQEGGQFKLLQVVPTVSKPVSIAFGHNHLYLLGTTTVESHKMNGELVEERPDGSARLLIGDGSAAQVGVLPNQLIISERSNMIELADLQNGILTGKVNPVQLPPPPKNDTPVGLVTRGDDAYVTIAHSDIVGLVKNGKLVTVVSSGDQHAPCWLALKGSWLYCSNTPSKSISRYNVSNTSINLVEPIAIQTKGEPTDIAAEAGILAALELGPMTRISQFKMDNEGRLKLLNTIPTASNANGIAILRTK